MNMRVQYNSSIRVFQTLGTRAALVIRSSRSTLQAIMEVGVSPPECESQKKKARTATLSSNSQKDKTFPLNGKYAGSIPASVKRRALVCSILLTGIGSSPLKAKIWVRAPYRVPRQQPFSIISAQRIGVTRKERHRRKPCSVYKLDGAAAMRGRQNW